MKFILKRNKLDSQMVEFYYAYAGKIYLACVMHTDCIIDVDVHAELGGTGEAEVEMKLVEG